MIMTQSLPRQLSFTQAEFTHKKKQTRRDRFLNEMEQVVPWARLIEIIIPHYPKGHRGRPPIALETILRMYFLQHWFGLADEAIEEALYDSQSFRHFMHLDLQEQQVPDSTTLMGFRHLLEKHQLTKALLVEINALLIERNLLMSRGTLVDATLIAAPSSTKNAEHQRDPEMHSTRKGNQWYFGLKANIGVDQDSGLVHTVITTAANVSDISQTAQLLHGQEQVLSADAGYVGLDKRADMQTAQEQNGQALKLRVAKRRSSVAKLEEGWQKQLASAYETLKATIRSRVEHPFHVIKNLFHYKKARYKGIAKNDCQLQMLFALSNLYMARGALRP
jgi:IS5 family transposase